MNNKRLNLMKKTAVINMKEINLNIIINGIIMKKKKKKKRKKKRKKRKKKSKNKMI